MDRVIHTMSELAEISREQWATLRTPDKALMNSMAMWVGEQTDQRESISEYQRGWNDAAMGRQPRAEDVTHAYRMGRADRESYFNRRARS